MDLDRGGADALGHLGGEQLRHRGFLQAGLARIAAATPHARRAGAPPRSVAMSARRKATAWCSMIGLPKAVALAWRSRAPPRTRRAPCRPPARRCRCARLRDWRARCGSPRLPSPSRVLLGHAHVVEDDLRRCRRLLAELFLDARPRRSPAYRVGTMKAVMPFLPASGSVTAKTMATSRVLARGDELLGAVEHVVVAVTPRAGLQVAGVGAGLRLGQAKQPSHLAAGQWSAGSAAFCASVPNFRIGTQPTELCTLMMVEHGAVAGGDLLERQRHRRRTPVSDRPRLPAPACRAARARPFPSVSSRGNEMLPVAFAPRPALAGRGQSRAARSEISCW